ncbi:TPA: hypothetical protein RQ794_003366 [Pseudomonas aeruginosa]|uniref:hypothetical protein n=2 Tax=Pseudomonas aeruginosa TaxID=287 RepID=UPI000946A177|nr:hypothetical protein [Pseudomonas aeruginosa]EJD6524322.1 hypothetical protein [Pseudomonas aeruginosa]EKT8214705.1 hypothetical protein [Pseudomonas aeruginosa]EKU0600036.1 hypothetical protein [Pseudomonas aeruginosa]EKV5213834.1 hypothetical protein [Pseudomonas aeruginosa]ELN4005197.1 hypothetical protein [Pseudomonas aeruginosa]
MNDLKNTTMLWKRMNYSAQKGRVKKTAGLSQLKSSLNHSLRTVMKKELEFNQDLSHRNFIIHNNKMIRLDSLTLEDRQSLVNEIMSSVQSDIGTHEDLSKLKDDRSKYAYKLKKLLSKADEPEALKTLITGVLEAQDSTLSPSLVDQVDSIGVKRANDKKKAIGTYIELHNEIIAAGNNSLHKSKTVVQECFFKFPTRNNINEVKPVDYLRIIHDFHKKHLPEYEIKTCVFHGDEVLSQNQINNGVHPHIFISGKNSKTGQYDLVQAQLYLVNRYLKSKGETEIKNNSFKASQKIGETYQRLVYEYVNKRLKEFGYNIEASVHEKTKEHKEKLEAIAKDANKAKIMRNFNLLSQTQSAIADAQKQMQEIKPILEEKRTDNKRLQEQNESLKTEIKDNTKTIKKQTQQIDNGTKELKTLDDRYRKTLNNYEKLENAIKKSNETYQAIQDVDIAIDVIAFLNSERRDIRLAFNNYKEKNIEALKKMTRKERIDFLEANSERLKREHLSDLVSTNLSLGEKTSLIIHDATQAVKSTINTVRRRMSGP